MTSDELTILKVLAEYQKPLYGLEIVKASDDTLSRGTVYVWLDSLEESGCISVQLEPATRAYLPGHIQRRQYSITDKGMRELALSAIADLVTIPQ